MGSRAVAVAHFRKIYCADVPIYFTFFLSSLIKHAVRFTCLIWDTYPLLPDRQGGCYHASTHDLYNYDRLLLARPSYNKCKHFPL